jgi:hypothetical protein
MMWEELNLGRLANEAEIKRALATALGIMPDTIVVVEGLPKAFSPPGARLLVERYVYPGQFPMRLSCNAFDVPAVDALTVIRKVCAALQTMCLVGDNSPDPLSWLRVTPDGAVERVLVDEDALERDELRIVQAHEKTRQARE